MYFVSPESENVSNQLHDDRSHLNEFRLFINVLRENRNDTQDKFENRYIYKNYKQKILS